MSQSIKKSLSKQKQISAIKTITRPKVKLFADDFPVKITFDQNLSKKQLLLKLDQIKEIKQSQFRNTLLRNETHKRNIIATEQGERKKIVYSNLQNRLVDKQSSSSKKDLEDGSESEYPFRYQSNFQLNPMHEIKESKETEKFVSERKKVVSVGAGFRKRSVKADQQNFDLGLRREKSQFKISRSVSRKVLYKEKIDKMQQKMQQNWFIAQDDSKYERNMLTTHKSSFQLIPTPTKFWSESNKKQGQKIKPKYQSNNQPENQKIQNTKAIEISPFKTMNERTLKRVLDLDQFTEELISKKLKNKRNQQMDQTMGELNDKEFFEQNGFGINMSLEKFDLLCLQDHDGQVFNKLFIGKTAKCPLYNDKFYRWADVRIIKYRTKTNKVTVELNLPVESETNKNNKQKSTKQLIQISRMSLNMDHKLLYSIKEQIITKLKDITENIYLSLSQMQITYMYLFQDYWQRVKIARQRLNSFRNYQKYCRYLKKLPLVFSVKHDCKFQPDYEALSHLLQDYKPSQCLNFQKRVPMHHAISKMVTEQCHEFYSKHFVTLSEMFSNPNKFTNDLNLQIMKFIPLRSQNNELAKELMLLPFRSQLYLRAKQIIQMEHYSKIPNFMTAMKNVMRFVYECEEETLNLHKMTKKLNSQVFGQVNNILGAFMQLAIYKKNLSVEKGMSLESFISLMGTSLQNSVCKVTKCRQHIISQLLFWLKDSFQIQSTTRTKKFLQEVSIFKKSMEVKYYSLVTIMHIELINELVYEARVRQFIGWINHDACLEVFILRVYIECSKSENNIVCEPKMEIFKSSLVNALDKYYLRLLNVDSLLGDLLIKPTSKIPIFNPMKQLIKSSIDKFSQKNYQTVFSQINQDIKPLLSYFSTCNFISSPYSFNSLQDYNSLLKRIESDFKKCRQFFITSPTVFVINLKQMKQSLSKEMKRHKDKTLKRIEKQVAEEVDNKYKEFSEYKVRLSFRPKIQEEYLQMKRFLSIDCDKFMINAEEHFRVTEGYFSLFEDFSYEFIFDLYVTSSRILIDHKQFKKQMENKAFELDQVLLELLQRINNQREDISRSLDSIRFKIQQITGYSSFADYPTYYVQTNKCYSELLQNENRLTNINRRQGLLKQEMSIFPTLKQLQKEIEPYYELYSSIYEIKSFDNDWKDKTLMDMNHKSIKELFDKNIAVLEKIGKTLVQRRNSEALAICQTGKSIINSNMQLLWMVEYLTKEAMVKKPLILKEAMDCIFEQNEYRTKQVTLNAILKQNITAQKRAFVIEKCLLAQKIYNLEKQLQTVVTSCKKLYFEYRKSKKLNQLPFIDQTQLMFWLSSIKEEKETVEIIEGNEVAHMINKKVQYVLNKVLLIESTLEVIDRFQQLIFRVTKIILKQEIKNEFSNDQLKKINDTESLWRNIITTFSKQLQLWQSIDSDSHKNKLSHGCNFYAQVLAKIERIVEYKIKSFPKLYFVPKSTLIRLLEQDNSTQLPTQILKIIFGSGFGKFIYKTDEKDPDNAFIQTVQSADGQMYKLKNQVNTKGIFWLKYAHIDDQINKIVKTTTANAIQSFSSPKDKPQTKNFILQLILDYLQWTADIERTVTSKEDLQSRKLTQKWLQIGSINIFETNLQQRRRQMINIQAKLFLRDMTEKLFKVDKSNRLSQWQKTPKYKVSEFNREQKICLSVTTKNPSDNKPLQMYLPFGTSLPDYQNHPIHQFAYSQNLNSDFLRLMTLRQVDYKNLSLCKQHKQAYRKIASHTLNHYVNPILNTQHQTNPTQTLKHFTRGFLLSQSFGLIDLETQCIQSAQKLWIIKFLAYTLDKINIAIEQRAYSLDILDINVKIGKHYRTNFAFVSQNIKILEKQPSVDLRLLKTSMRQISLCQLNTKHIFLYKIESFTKLHEFQQKDVQKMIQFVSKLYDLTIHLKYSVGKCMNFFKQVSNEIELRQQVEDKPKFVEQIIIIAIKMLSKENSSEDLLEAIQSLKLQGQFESVKIQLKSMQKNELHQSRTHQLTNFINQFQLNAIENFSFDQFVKLQKQQQTDDEKININQIKSITLENFTQVKQIFLNNHFMKQLHSNRFSPSKNKIIVNGDKVISGKTESILKIFNRIIQKTNTFHQFLANLHSFTSQKNYQMPNQILNTIICNTQENKLIPLIECRNNNKFSKCYKWHYHQVTFCNNFIQMLQSDQNFIIQAGNQSKLNQLTPSIVFKAVFFHLPTIKCSRQQIVDYQFSKQFLNESAYKIQAKRIFLIVSKDKAIDSSLTQLKFMTILKNYLSFIQIFSKSIQTNAKVSDITELLLMVLLWSLYPFLNLQKTNLTAADFGSTLQKPLNQVYNWYYSIQKHTWIEWATQTDFFDIKQSDSSNQILYIPVNESVSFTYFLHKLSTSINCQLIAEQKGSGLSFLTDLIQKKQLYSKCSVSGAYSMERLHLMFGKQSSKTNLQGILTPNKDRSVQFIIEDVNLSFLEQPKYVCNNRYLASLFNYNFDINRKQFFDKIHFILSFSEQDLNLRQTYCDRFCKDFAKIKLKKYSQESCKYIFRKYLDEFFGNTQNPYSKDIRETTTLIIYQLISLKNFLSANKDKEQVGFDRFLKIIRNLERSTPKVVKQAEHILSLLQFEIKRQLIDTDDFQNDMKYGLQQQSIKKVYNKTLNVIIEKLFFNQQLQFHKEELGLKEFNHQKLQTIRQLLTKSKIANEERKNQLKRFQKDQIVYCKLKDEMNQSSYKEYYRFYEGIDHVAKIIENSIKAKIFPESLLPLLYSKELISDIIKMARIFTCTNTHALVHGFSFNNIKKFCSLAVFIGLNYSSSLYALQMQNFSQFKENLKTLIKDHFKKYLKSQQTPQIPILVTIPQHLNQQNLQDMQLLCEFLETNEFTSWLHETKAKKYKENLMKQLKIRSLQSPRYEKFVVFCKQKIHFIFGLKFKKSEFFCNFPSLLRKTHVKLDIAQMSDFSQMETSTRSILASHQLNKDNLLLYKLYKVFQKIIGPDSLLTEGKYHKFCQLSNLYIQKNEENILTNISIRNQVIAKINEIFQFKKYLERKLQRLEKKEQTMKAQHQEKLNQRKLLYSIERQKHDILMDQQSSVQSQERRCKQLQAIVDEQMSKVGPILQRAQAVLQKVTRDDINQLRSFPNPPIPAAKVCESLVFLFDEVHLIKQKVLETGEKIKDFWEYAKKQILNDKLVKRISDFSQQTIKSISKQVIQTVREITKKQEFQEQRVFKASGAAGNLSLWVRAVVQTYDVLQVIQPKKTQLRQNQQILNGLKDVLAVKRSDYEQANLNLQNKNIQIQKSNQELHEIKQEIISVKQQIANIEKLLVFLMKYKEKWNQQILSLSNQEKIELNYFSVWSAFTQVFLPDLTESQIIKVFSHLTNDPKVDVSEGFVKWIKKTHLVKNSFKLTFQSQISLLTLIDQFKDHIAVVSHFIENCMPYSKGEIFLNKITSFFKNWNIFQRQSINSCWIIDEASIFKGLFKNAKQFNSSELSDKFGLKITEVIDCMKYSGFDSYLAQSNMNTSGTNQQHIYSDQQSDEQGNQDDVQQANEDHIKNLAKQRLTQIVIITNIQHCLDSFCQNVQLILSYFSTQNLVPVFITDFTNNILAETFKQISYFSTIDLSESTFRQMVLNGINFLKLQKSKTYKLWMQVHDIKCHYDELLKKLSFNPQYNQNQTYSKIQSLLENDNEVQILIQAFKALQKNQNRMQLIKKQFLSKKNDFETDQLSTQIKNLYLSFQTRDQHKKGEIFLWKNHITYDDFINKYLIENFVIFLTLKELNHSCHDKPQEQFTYLMNDYLTKDHRQTSKSLNKFIEYLTVEGQRYNIKQKDTKMMKKDKSKSSLIFPQVINCLVLQQKTEIQIIPELKNIYEQSLMIIDQSSVAQNQLPMNQGDFIMYYSKRVQLVILSKSVTQANKILKFLQTELRSVIYKKCINQKEMDDRQLIRYLNEHEDFRVFVLLDQNYARKEEPNNKKRLIMPWSKQYQKIFIEDGQPLEKVQPSEDQSIQKALETQVQGVFKKRKGAELIKSLWEKIQQQDQQIQIIEKHIKIYYNAL